MSVLAQLYGEAKGIEKSLDMMNKSLVKLQAQDKKSNDQEQKFRQEILKYKRRERADQQRNQDFLADTMDNAIGKKAGKKMMGGGLMAALAAGLGVAVAASLAGKGLLGGDDPDASPGTPAAPGTPGSEGAQPHGGADPAAKPDQTLKNPFRNIQEDPRNSIPGGKAQDASDKVDRVRNALAMSDAIARSIAAGRLLPGIGTAIGGADLAIDVGSGRWIGAALNAIGISEIPWISQAADILNMLYDRSLPQEEIDKQNMQLLKLLHKNGIKEIPQLGNVEEIIKEYDAYTKERESAQMKRLGGYISAFQSGGFTGLVPSLGQPTTGDHFYTSVAPGSYIMNRNLVDAMGYQSGGVPVALEAGEVALPPGSYDKESMDYLNHVAFPRFQEGGIVEADHPHTGSGFSIGKDSQGRPSVFSREAAEALMKAIKASDGAVKTSDITSSKRSPKHNTRVGGVENSNHLSGNAVDIHGSSKAWLKEHGPKYGWHNLNYSGHDGHFDFKGGGSSGAPQRTEGNNVKETKEQTASTTGQQGGGGILKEFADQGALGQATANFMSKLLSGAPKVIQNLLGFGGFGGGGGGDKQGNRGGPGRSGDISKLGSGGGTLQDLTDQQWSDLAYIVSSEAARGTDDIYGVAANVLTRVADPAYPNTIMGVGTQAGQYEAVYKGMAVRDEKLAAKLKENSSKIAEALQVLNGRTDFKGQTMLSNKGESDPMFHGRGNFYHYSSQTRKGDPVPDSPPQHWKQWLGQQRGGAIKYMRGGNVLADNLQNLNESFKMQQMASQQPIVVYEDEPQIAATMSGGAENNDPFYLPTRSASWASAIMEFRERTFNQGY